MADTQNNSGFHEEYGEIKMETAKKLLSFVDSLKKGPPTDSELLREIQKYAEELRNLKKAKRYGLVWEEKPEEFESASKNALPVLEEEAGLAIINDPGSPENLIIEGDNYHSLATLSFTHAGKIDVIYIDPPYNTGSKDFIYNDRYVDKEDDFRHSKWLSFMSKRLELAKSLLTDTGVIFMSIDENEQAQLKMLCDEVFNNNLVAQITLLCNPKWRSQDKYFSTNHEYILVYSKYELPRDFFSIEKDEDRIGKEYKLKDEAGLYRLLELRNTHREFNRQNRPNLFYPFFVDPNSGNISLSENEVFSVKVEPLWPDGFEGCWTWWRELSTKDIRLLAAKKSGWKWKIYRKSYAKSTDGEVAKRKLFTIWQDSRFYTEKWQALFGEIFPGFNKNDFPQPKSLELIAEILRTCTNHKSTVLDFFAWSGTTGNAVLSLNKEDGGNRRFILCSNKENSKENPDKNLCRNVCYERIKRVSSGYKNSKDEDIVGLGGNIRYFRTSFVPHKGSMDDLRHAFVDRCSDLLRIKSNCFTVVENGEFFRVYSGKWKSMAILFDPSKLDLFKEYLANSEGPVEAFIFTISPETFTEELSDFSERLEIEPIPDNILSVYRKIFRI